jgi:hypothetical protein
MDSKTFNSLSESYASIYSEAVYGGTSTKAEEPKDNRMTVTAADKKANTPAYQKFKAGDKNYKSADHMKESEEVEEGYKELSRDKRNTMFRKAGNLSRAALQGGDKGTEAGKKSGKIVKALNKDAEKYDRNDVKEELKASGLFTEEEINAILETDEQFDEAMSSYDRNRKRAAQRAADRNAARAAGKTGVVPGVGYVSPRKERETYVDSAGTTRHKSGAKMP